MFNLLTYILRLMSCCGVFSSSELFVASVTAFHDFSWSCSQDTRVHLTISAHNCAIALTSVHFTIFLIVLTSMHFTIFLIVLSSVHFTIPACSCMFLHILACSRFGPIWFQLLSTSIYLPTIFLIVLTSSNSLPRSLFLLSVGVSSTILGKRVHASYGNSVLVRENPLFNISVTVAFCFSTFASPFSTALLRNNVF